MKMITKFALTALCLSFLVAAQAKKPQTVVPQAAKGFGVTLAIDKMSYSAGKIPLTLHAVMTLFNNTGTPLVFSERGRSVEWQVLDSHRNVVWDYSIGRSFPMFIIRRTLTSGKLDYPCDIPLTMQDGTPLPPGNYALKGQLTGVLCSAEVGFTVVK